MGRLQDLGIPLRDKGLEAQLYQVKQNRYSSKMI